MGWKVLERWNHRIIAKMITNNGIYMMEEIFIYIITYLSLDLHARIPFFYIHFLLRKSNKKKYVKI